MSDGEGSILLQLFESLSASKWVIIGVVLLILELVTGTTYILWPAAAALAVGFVAFILPIPWTMQLLLFFIVSSVLLVVGHKYVGPKINQQGPSDLNDRAQSMVGMRVKAIANFETGLGRVQVGDTQWRASIAKGKVKAGQELRVLSVKGTTLQVEHVED